MPTLSPDPLAQRLQTLVQDAPELNDAAQVYAAILPLLRERDLRVSPIAMTREQARTKLESGLPLLHDLDLDLDYGVACELMIELARALEQSSAGEKGKHPLLWRRGKGPDAVALYEQAHTGDTAMLRAAAARQIRLALEQGNLDPRALLPRVAAGESEYVTTLATGLKLDPGLLWTIAQNVLKPALRAWCRQSNSLVEGIDWRRGYCPICGSAATLGELRDNDQVRYLRCSQCGADWQFPRLQCMYCGNEDHSTLGYLYPEGQREKLRIQVCDQCGGYLKLISTFSATPVELVPVEDLSTLLLDYIAQEHGYARVAVR